MESRLCVCYPVVCRRREGRGKGGGEEGGGGGEGERVMVIVDLCMSVHAQYVDKVHACVYAC